MIFEPIYPAFGTGQTVSAGAAAAALTNLNADAKQLILTNIGAALAYVRLTTGTDTSNATIADYPIIPNTQRVIGKGLNTRISYIAPVATTLHVMTGEGFI